MWLALVGAALAVTPLDPAEARDSGVVLAVFQEPPTPKEQARVVRHAFKRSRALHDGREWGRVLCFRFDGPSEPDVVRAAVEKAGLQAQIKAGVTCEEPPGEAFVEREPTAWLRVRFPDTVPAELAQSTLATLLRLELGVVAVKISPAVAGRLCLELAGTVDAGRVQAAAEALGLEVLGVEPASSCVDALSDDP